MSRNKNYILSIFLIAVALVSYILFAQLAGSVVAQLPPSSRKGFQIPTKYFELVKNIYRAVYLFSLSVALWLGRKTIAQGKEMFKLKLANLEAENAFLRAQANPHLLFNVLNDIHEDLIADSPQQAEIVMLLADMMHYAYQPQAADGKISLAEEIHSVETYLKLQQSRKTDPLELYLDNTLPVWGFRIPPMILLTLVENIVKYGEVNDHNNPALIVVKEVGNNITIKTKNKFASQVSHHSATHVGLDNIKRRLNYIYGTNYELKITSGNEHFEIELSLPV